MSKEIISLDIDGVVVNYPGQMYEYAEKYIGMRAQSKSELIAALKLKNLSYENFKLKYRKKYECIDGYECNAKVTSDFWKFYERLLKVDKFEIIFRTTRPIKSYPNQLKNTHKWLNSIGINCVRVLPKDEESFNQFNPVMHIDDEVSHLEAHLLYTSSDKLIFYNKENNFGNLNKFKEVNSLVDIWNIINY